MPLSFREVSQPVAEPVSLDQAKYQCRVDFPDDDNLLIGYITAARQLIEKMTGRSIFNRKMKMTLDYFPLPGCTVSGSSNNSYVQWYLRGTTISLPQPSTASVESISYTDSSGQSQTIDPANYVVDLNSEPARISPAPGCTWPYPQNYLPGQITIEYTSGTYGDGLEVNNCPQSVVMAILLLVGHWYANREASTATPLATIPLGVRELIAAERVEAIY